MLLHAYHEAHMGHPELMERGDESPLDGVCSTLTCLPQSLPLLEEGLIALPYALLQPMKLLI